MMANRYAAANGPGSDGMSELVALSQIIQASLNAIQQSLAVKKMEFPSLHTPLTLESEAARMQPEVEKECTVIVAAAYQLIASVRSPVLSITNLGMEYTLSAALGVAITANVPEALKEAGHKGAHVQDIARASNVDPAKLGRILRALATNHIFTEVAPDVFANNRLSSAMDTGKSVESILANPNSSKHIGANGIAACVGACADEGIKAGSYLQEAFFDPKLAVSGEPTETALNLAFNTKVTMWDWFAEKGNEHRSQRFNVAMAGVKLVSSPAAILEGFDWKALKQDAIVVDVGGGIGSQSLIIAQHNEHLRFIVQDREPVVKDAVKFWDERMPGALTSKKVVLQAHDFFAPQPVQNAAVFVLHCVMHDWSDDYCVQILRRLRDAASADTQLVIFDILLSYACDDDETLKAIPGAERAVLPKPLLPNGGHAATSSYQLDIMMVHNMNGQERTVLQMKNILELAKWNTVRVHQSPIAKVICIPA
ncbi:O-methyltransferase [Phanerochaete sordida]|uniref:O-methyltransferase n=1 Tax=Phanerochaete sordida TaxID=48140 RepID=A0A9P3LAZ4_9APHY|nr:O-methyltransferase [Phanerochaete sordida]